MANYSPGRGHKSVNDVVPHYGWLDFCRFLAALIVVVTHVRGFLFVQYGALTNKGFMSAIFFALTKLGQEAVIVFFVLSGYLVGGKAIERMLAGRFDPADYAIDRISRIWVPLFPALILSALISPVGDGFFVWCGNIFGLQHVLVPELGGNGPLWSLAYEIWFYILIYAVGRQVTKPGFDIISLLLMISVALVFTKLEPQYMLCWIVGALFYIKPHRLSSVQGGLVAGGVMLASVAMLQLTGDGIMAKVHIPHEVESVFYITLAAGFGYGLIPLTRLPANKLCTWASPMAAFSYTLYLTHYPLLLWIRWRGWGGLSRVGIRELGLFFGVTLACVLLAWLIYLPFERNTGRIRSLIKSWR